MNDSNEVTIKFKDYMLYTLHRWKGVLILALICAVIIGGVYAMVKLSGWKSDVDNYNQEVNSLDETFAEYEALRNAYQTELDYEIMRRDEVQDYIMNSVYYTLNAGNVLVTKADIYISAESDEISPEKMDSILKLYMDGIDVEADWDKIGQQVGLERKYVRELVQMNIDYSADIIELRILYPSIEGSNAIIDAIMSEAEIVNKDLQSLAKFKAEIYNQSSYADSLEELDSAREAVNKKFNSYNDKIESAQNELDSLKEPTSPDYVRRKDVLIKTVIFAIIVFIMTVIIAFVVCYYEFTRKGIIYSAGEFKRITGIKNIGVFGIGNKDKKSGFIDRKIDKMSDDYSEESDEKVIEKIIFSLEDAVGDKESVLLIGSVNEERMKDISEKIASDFNKSEINTTTDISDDIDNIKLLAKTDKVVLVSQREKTSLNALLKTIDFIKQYDKEIIGNIVI